MQQNNSRKYLILFIEFKKENSGQLKPQGTGYSTVVLKTEEFKKRDSIGQSTNNTNSRGIF